MAVACRHAGRRRIFESTCAVAHAAACASAFNLALRTTALMRAQHVLACKARAFCFCTPISSGCNDCRLRGICKSTRSVLKQLALKYASRRAHCCHSCTADPRANTAPNNNTAPNATPAGMRRAHGQNLSSLYRSASTARKRRVLSHAARL